jgi:adenylate cyclase
MGVVAPAPDGRYDEWSIRRARLLYGWEAAGLPLSAVAALVETGEFSLSFLDAASMAGPAPEERSQGELADAADVPFALVQRIHEALGFAPPEPHDPARQDDSVLLTVARMFTRVGVSETGLLGVFSTYADALRRVAKAEAEMYEIEIERPLRSRGFDEDQLVRFGTDMGDEVLPLLERALVAVYRRHREHVWIEHALNHAEVKLDEKGIRPNTPHPPAICFVDLTGYTRMTEERGDAVAADVARRLSSLVHEVSRRHRGRPIRWLGDGGMFHFREPSAAVEAGLDMTDEAPRTGLPPTHIGIHTGHVVFQDGDVYGRTVNIASRIASRAEGGQVLVSIETMQASAKDGLAFRALPPVALKGVEGPVLLYEASRGE